MIWFPKKQASLPLMYLKLFKSIYAVKLNFKEIIAENERRMAAFTAPYDPVKGIGSPIPRGLLSIPELDIEIYIPTEMFEKSEVLKSIFAYNSFQQFQQDSGLSAADIVVSLNLDRLKYDFEFWAATCAVIKDRKTGADFNFVLRKAQRKLLARLEEMRRNNKPIWFVLLKARQWGGSTLVQMYMMWIQQIHKINWNLAVCAQDDAAASNISEMYTNAAEHYPKDVATITLKPYARSSKNRINKERGGIIGVGSINNPKQFRSYRYFMIHLSEVGVWENTLKRSPEELAASLMSSIPDVPYSLIGLESTAKGIGNYFHDMWISATEKKTGFEPIFVAWWEIEDYQEEIQDYKRFIEGMKDYDWFLWKIGATLEGINWYKNFKKSKNYRDHKMQEEFPSTAEEAFVSSGQKVYAPEYIEACEQDVREPEFVGDIAADGRMGENAFKNIHFIANPMGRISMWGRPDKTQLVKNRYCFFADIGGRTDEADFSVLRGMDRYWMMDGGDPEFILTWHGHLDQDLFAWQCAQVCMAFAIPEIDEYPLLAIEVNSLKKEASEGDHFYTVLNKIAPYYPNLYIRNDYEKVGASFVPKYGFHTNHKSKGMIIDTKNASMRERYNKDRGEQEHYALIERDQRAINESKWFETKANGEMGAVEGKHDDIEVTSAGCNWLATEYMEKPYFMEERTKPVSQRRVKRASDF